MKPQLISRIAVIGLVALFSVSCGGSDKPSTAKATSATKPATITRKAFLAKGNAICKRMNDRQRAIPKSTPETTIFEVADGFYKTAANMDRALEELEALPVPKGDEAKLDAIFRRIRAMTDHVYTWANDASSGATMAYLQQGIDQLQAEADKANALSAMYGLTVCAEES
jgi:hypothetical protein